MALAGTFSTAAVTLNPGTSQTVQLSSGTPDLLTPQSYPVAVAAVSRTDSRIRDMDKTTVSFTGYEEVEITWLPASQTVTDTLQATFKLLVTNNSNVNANIALSASATPSSDVNLAFINLPMPPGAAAQLPVTVQVKQAGIYELSATADSTGATFSDTAKLTVLTTTVTPEFKIIYLPFVVRNN